MGKRERRERCRQGRGSAQRDRCRSGQRAQERFQRLLRPSPGLCHLTAATPGFELQYCGLFLLCDNLRAPLLIPIKCRVIAAPLTSPCRGTRGGEQDSRGESPEETPHRQRGPGCVSPGLSALLHRRMLYLNCFCLTKGGSRNAPPRGCVDRYRAAQLL